MSLLRRIQTMKPEYCPKCGAKNAFVERPNAAPVCGKCGHSLLPVANSPTSSSPPPPIPTPSTPPPTDDLTALFEGDAPAITDDLAALFEEEIPAPPTPVTPLTSSGFRTPSGRDLSRYKPSALPRDKENATAYIIAVFSSAMTAMERQDYAETMRHLRRCFDENPDFIDARLWLSRLEDDPDVRMKHAKYVLAMQPSNGEAMREVMILKGELDPDADFTDFTEAPIRQADGAVASHIRSIKCPRCGSPNMSDDDAEGTLLTCDSCGYKIDKPKVTGGGLRSLTAALIQRRSQAVVWVVGSRTLKCKGCGAERTLPRTQLSSECPFCGSRQVIEQDALGSLTQPDGLVPFRVPKQAALELVKKSVTSGMEKFKSFFVENRVVRTEISGVFLPFWVFDAMVDITHVYELVESNNNQDRTTGTVRLLMGDMGGVSNFSASTARRLITENLTDAVLNAPLPAFKQPSPDLALRVGRYDYGRAVDYHPDFIAQHAAEIYTVDFDKASMDVRETVSKLMREKYKRDDGYYRTVNIMAMMTQATFRLMLVPMWAVTIFEKDGDVRPVLVNGQTGHVALGRATKPR